MTPCTPTRGGSSPLARGTPNGAGRTLAVLRFIPARAGNTGPPRPRAVLRPVHPRSRGEHVAARSDSGQAAGSSPLARGTHHHARPRPGRSRFIPARAGNTRGRRSAPTRSPVHPRSRGEHRPVRERIVRRRGSSPLARGTPPARSGVPPLRRFIPARAGNTPECPAGRSRRSVHPRSRGEHIDRLTEATLLRGSSPLARGTRRVPRLPPLGRRFIPARAGNTRCRPLPPRAGSVHPRSRGEHAIEGGAAKRVPGSSPLARGTPRRAGRGRDAARFIPARAGNTHTATALCSALCGSSPLARGTQRRDRR